MSKIQIPDKSPQFVMYRIWNRLSPRKTSKIRQTTISNQYNLVILTNNTSYKVTVLKQLQVNDTIDTIQIQ
mgnify:CR=1 FL=1